MERNGSTPRARIPMLDDEEPTNPALVELLARRRWIKALQSVGILAGILATVATGTWAVQLYLDGFEKKADAQTRDAREYVLHEALKSTDVNHEGRLVGLERSDALQEKRLDWMTSTLWEFAKKEGLRVPPPPKEE